MGKVIRSTIIAFLALLLAVLSAFAFDPSNDTVDYENMPASEKHRILAEMKAKNLAVSRLLAAAAEKTPSLYDQTEYDVGFYDIDLNIDIVAESIAGNVLMEASATVDNLDSIEVDLYDDLIVDSVYSSSGYLNYAHNNNKVFVELDGSYNTGETFSFSIAYHGVPVQSGFLGFSFDLNIYGNKVVSSLSEPMAARTWWPCKDRPDDKADSIDITVTVDEPYYCASNGALIDTVHNGDGTWTFNYEVRYPIAAYLFSVAIAEYSVWKNYYHYGANDSMEIVHHVYPERYIYSLDKYSITPDIAEVFVGLFGEYPFLTEKYGHANFEWGGGMEHQTVTSMTGGDFGFDQDIVAHELAHQWWGDMITCENWHHIWLNEGFASYCEALYREVRNGVADYHDYMAGMYYEHGGTIYVYDTTDVWSIFTSRIYDKGAWVLHMLRHVVGDSTFFDALQAYYGSEHQYSHASTADLQAIFETVSGMDLAYFFDQWIYGTFFPRYNWSYMSEPNPAAGGYTAYFYLWQTQASYPDLFAMPIDLVVTYAGGIDTIVQFNDVKDTIYIYHTDEQPTDIFLDPDDWILKQSTKTSWIYHLIPFPLDSAGQYQNYLDSVVAKGGSGDNRYFLNSGALPEGLTLDSLTGHISGMPSEFGDFVFTVMAEDNGGTFLDLADYHLYVAESPAMAGDANSDSTVNLLDITFIIDYVYNGGPEPVLMEQADPDQSCLINILDVTYLINYLYRGGPDPLWGCAE